VGPVGYYTSLGGNSSSGRRASTGTSSRGLAAAAKAQQAQELLSAITAILDLHRQEFAPTQRPLAPPPHPVDEVEILDRHVRAALQGVGRFDRSGRAKAKEAARLTAAAEARARKAENERVMAEYQRELDIWWDRLLANEPAFILERLAAAFEDNEAAAAPVGVEGDEVSLVVAVPPVSDLPERLPTTTPAGNLSLKKLTKGESADLYKQMVCGYVLTTVKEAFAVAPAIRSVRIVALRTSAPDAYGGVQTEAILATRINREALEGVQWASASSVVVVRDAGTETLMRVTGPSKNLAPLDLSQEPELRLLLDAVDLAQLVD
jgi:hypothetical protein